MGMLAKKLGSRIKELREKRGFTQFKLAEILDMEASNLSKIERGVQIPKEESLINIAKALQVKISDLFDFEYMQDKEKLVTEIIDKLNKSSLEDIKRFYKILVNL